MTNYYARLNGCEPRGRNKKDGGGPHRRNSQDWEKLGFEWVPPTPSTYIYTWGGGDFPTFKICPGHFQGQAGLVAECDNVIFLLPYGTDPAAIKQLLDLTITEIICSPAGIDEPLTDEIDFDDWMRGA